MAGVEGAQTGGDTQAMQGAAELGAGAGALSPRAGAFYALSLSMRQFFLEGSWRVWRGAIAHEGIAQRAAAS